MVPELGRVSTWDRPAPQPEHVSFAAGLNVMKVARPAREPNLPMMTMSPEDGGPFWMNGWLHPVRHELGPPALIQQGTWSQAPEVRAPVAAACPVPSPPALVRHGTWSQAPEAPASSATAWLASNRPVLVRQGTLSQAPEARASGAAEYPFSSPPVLVRQGTWSQAPEAPATAWLASNRPVLVRQGTWSQAPEVPASAFFVSWSSTPVPASPLKPSLRRASTVLETHMRPVGLKPTLHRSTTDIAHQSVGAGSGLQSLEKSVALAEAGRLLLSSVLRSGPPRQLRIIVSGLMGSGKSTLCRMLRHLLDGAWINQDECASKKAFLAEIVRRAGDSKTQAVLVDKINTMFQHREEIRKALDTKVPGDIVFVQMKHPADAPGKMDRALSLCMRRIGQRGDRHRTLHAGNPQLQSILSSAAKGAEMPSAAELQQFRAVFSVDMTLNPVESVKRLLAELDEEGLLMPPRFDVDILKSDAAVAGALQAAKDHENVLQPREDAKKGKAEVQRKEKFQKPPSVWFWAINLDEVSTQRLRSVWEEQATAEDPAASAAASPLKPTKELHTTLLYIGGGSDAQVAAANPKIPGPEEAAAMRASLSELEGKAATIQVIDMVWDGRVAAAEVCIEGTLAQLCANAHPHITLALAEKVPAVASNELLARRAASLKLKEGLAEWLRQIGLKQYEEKLAAWCESMGAAKVEEIADNALEAAAALEPADKDAIQTLASILRKGKPCFTRSASLQLTGTVHGWLGHELQRS